MCGWTPQQHVLLCCSASPHLCLVPGRPLASFSNNLSSSISSRKSRTHQHACWPSSKMLLMMLWHLAAKYSSVHLRQIRCQHKRHHSQARGPRGDLQHVEALDNAEMPQFHPLRCSLRRYRARQVHTPVCDCSVHSPASLIVFD
jgi:hypothetical protein